MVTDRRRALLVNQDLPPRTGEEAMFEAGCHAMLSSVAGERLGRVGNGQALGGGQATTTSFAVSLLTITMPPSSGLNPVWNHSAACPSFNS